MALDMKTANDTDKEKHPGPQVSDSSTAVSIRDGQQHEEKPFTTWTAMGMGHSITNSAVGITVALANGLPFGGPPVFFWGYLAMSVVAFCVAVSLGELASALPHSGGQYFWVATLAPRRSRRFLSYMTAIMEWAGAVCTTASTCLVVVVMVVNMAAFANPAFTYSPWMVFVGYQALNLVLFGFNVFESWLPWISKGLLFYTCSMLFAIFIALVASSSHKQSAESFFLSLSNISGWGNGVAFMIGLNPSNWCFSCLDAAVHLADEVPAPRTNIPKALLYAVALGTFTGFLTLSAHLVSYTDYHAVMASATPSLMVYYQAYSSKSAALAVEALVTISSAGAIVGTHTWQSRIAWAFSRDRGFPFHAFQSRIAREPFNTPIWAHVWSNVWVAVLGCLYLASSLAFASLVASGRLLQYLTYSTAIALLLWNGRSNFEHGPFWYPKLGLVANIITVWWTLTSLCFYSLPYYMPVEANQMNYVSCVLVVVVFYGLVYWFFHGRREYRLPEPRHLD